MIIYNNGKYMEETECFISTLSDAFLYGMSFFETMKVTDGNIEFLDEHIRRINESLSTCSTITLTSEWVESIVSDLLIKNNNETGTYRVKVLVSPKDAFYMVSLGDYRYTDRVKIKGFKVKYAIDRRNPMDRLTYQKSSNYMTNKRNLNEVQKEGFDECIFLNTEGKITEGSFTNIFFKKGPVFYTPKIEDGILPGIMRKAMIDNLKGEGKEIVECSLDKDFYKSCDGAFLTNSLMGTIKVRLFEKLDYFTKKRER